MKWIYNPNSNELINTDTGSTIALILEPEYAPFECRIRFYGPIVSITDQDYPTHSAATNLYQGTARECVKYIKGLVSTFGAFRLEEGHGTPRPIDDPDLEPRRAPVDYSDQCSSDLPF